MTEASALAGFGSLCLHLCVVRLVDVVADQEGDPFSLSCRVLDVGALIPLPAANVSFLFQAVSAVGSSFATGSDAGHAGVANGDDDPSA